MLDDALDAWRKFGHLASPYELLVEESLFAINVVMIGQFDNTKHFVRDSIGLDVMALPQPARDKRIRNTILDMRDQMREAVVADRSYRTVRLWVANRLNLDWILVSKDVPPGKIQEWAEQADVDIMYTDPQEQAAVDKVREKRVADMARVARVTPPVSKKKRTPKCPVHEVPFEFSPDENIWLCREPRKGGKPGQLCNLRQGPRLERTNGEFLMGEGRVELQVVAMVPGVVPRLVLVAANNVAIDITELVTLRDIAGFEKIQSAYRQAVDDKIDMKRVEDTVVSVPVVVGVFTIMGAGTSGG